MTAQRDISLGKLVIVGVGLIGGSFALALKSAAAVSEVVGIGRTRANLRDALERQIVDRVRALDESWMPEFRDADVVLYATPVGELQQLLASTAEHLGPHTIALDVGSTKQDVIAAARATLGAALPRFVPSHPIAGTEHTGAKAAFATLFRDRKVVLTPMPETDPVVLQRVSALWRCTGATVCELDAALHDRIFAAVSHLPHVLAFTLVDELARREDAETFFGFAASGFRDFTRIAASSPEMWRDIALANRDALLRELANYRDELDRMAALIRAGDAHGLHQSFARASAARRAWGAAGTSNVPADGPREA
ncbi:MAG: prephenate dehydrogenase/arogenate dehydrogenase family protein [Pseudomonadota bacterium]|nr:prephenate dehydrogenase/arogenate dehydrogenase family protein [Pseudomonadota bacterium]